MENPNQKYDEFFMEILQDKKTVVGFLQTIFSFLSRRTDFYHESRSNALGLGFPPGIKEKLVQQVLQQYDPRKQVAVRKHSSLPKVAATAPEPPQQSQPQTSQSETSPSERSPLPPPPPPPPPQTPPPAVVNEVEVQTTLTSPPTVESKSTRTINFLPTESHNGACYDFYCWSQTISDLEIYIILPDHIASSKQLHIKIDLDYIKVTEKLTDTVIFSGKLSSKCRNSEAVWSLANKRLQITLDKLKETWWDRLLDTEPKIDLNKMECYRQLEELPQESQAVIEKLRWDHQQKVLGLPTSEDLKNRQILETAWNAEGSPFKGQPFDPSIVKFN